MLVTEEAHERVATDTEMSTEEEQETIQHREFELLKERMTRSS